MSEKKRSTSSKRGKAVKEYRVRDKGYRVREGGGRVSKSRTDVARLDAMTDDDVARQIAEDPDVAPEFTEEMARDAIWMRPEKKLPISFRVDGDVLEFFKLEGPGYQSRMNAVLRSYMEHQRKRGRARPPRR